MNTASYLLKNKNNHTPLKTFEMKKLLICLCMAFSTLFIIGCEKENLQLDEVQAGEASAAIFIPVQHP